MISTSYTFADILADADLHEYPKSLSMDDGISDDDWDDDDDDDDD